MKKMLPFVVGLFMMHSLAHTQVKLAEDFEAGLNIPQGWSVWNAAAFDIDPTAQWAVRDTADTNSVPGITGGFPQAHSSTRAIGVSWWAGIDTNTSAGTQADAWLITKRITGIAGGDSLVFWGSGGATSYLDSLEVWISTGDSTPATQSFLLGSIVWPVGSVYGEFQRYAFDISGAAGIDSWIGFRYNQEISVDGFFVYIDDVTVGQPATAVSDGGKGLPSRLRLRQNYPNPFNPSTAIEFEIPQSGHTTLKIFDALGQEVATLIDGMLSAGSYRTTWLADRQSSGMYFYQLQSGGVVDTRKLMLLR